MKSNSDNLTKHRWLRAVTDPSYAVHGIRCAGSARATARKLQHLVAFGDASKLSSVSTIDLFKVGVGLLRQINKSFVFRFSTAFPDGCAKLAPALSILMILGCTVNEVRAGEPHVTRIELFKRLVAGKLNVARFSATRIQEAPKGIDVMQPVKGTRQAHFVGAWQDPAFWIANTPDVPQQRIFIGTNIHWIVGSCGGVLWNGGINFYQENQSTAVSDNDSRTLFAVNGRRLLARTISMGLRQLDMDEEIEFEGTNFLTSSKGVALVSGYLIVSEIQDEVTGAVCRYPSSRFRGHVQVNYDYNTSILPATFPSAFLAKAYSDEGKSWVSDEVKSIDINLADEVMDSATFCPQAFLAEPGAKQPMHVIISNSLPMLVTSNGLELIPTAHEGKTAAPAIIVIAVLLLSGVGYIILATVKRR